MNFVEITATVLGLIQGVLILKNLRINWLFYVLQMIFLVVFSYQNNLFGDVALNALFVLFGLWAWWSWGKPQNRVSTTGANFLIHTLVASVATCGLFLYLLGTPDPLPLKDAITTVGGIWATIYMVQHKLETWVVWFFVDVLYVWEYASLEQPAWGLATLNVIWTVLAVGSFWSWYNKYDDIKTFVPEDI